MFRSFPLCLCGAGHRQSGVTLNGNPKGKTTLKMSFPFAGDYLPRRKFIWSKDLLFSFLLSFIDRELFCFPLIFSFLLPCDLLSGILLFLFFSFFSFSSPFAKKNSPRTNCLNSFCVSLLSFPKEQGTNRLNSFVSPFSLVKEFKTTQSEKSFDSSHSLIQKRSKV